MRFIEKAMRGKLVCRRLPKSLGSRQVFVSPDSQLSYLRPFWHLYFKKLLDTAFTFVRPGYEIWDIGANVGVFSVASAHLTGSEGHVLSLEPDPFLAWALQKTAQCRCNSDLQVDIVCAAVSDRAQLARFHIAARGRSSNSLEEAGGRDQAGGTRHIQYVPVVTLDSLATYFRPPNLVKIDVEGAEFNVLSGGMNLLRNHRPVIHVEVGKAQQLECTRFLKDLKYSLYNADSDFLSLISQCSFNTLATPFPL